MSIRNLLQFRDKLNDRLSDRLSQLYSDGYFRNELFNRIQKGRKIRSLLFVVFANDSLETAMGDSLLDVCLSIELSHAASVLVDDILDGDDTRHGNRSSHSIMGTPKAALQAHFLCAEALKLISSNPSLLSELLATYHKLSIGEMYDVFLPTPVEQWMCGGYDEKVYQKTSALFEYSLVASALISSRSEKTNELRMLGRQIGKLYQLSNDYHDLQPHNLRKRHAENDSWRVTFSYPLALYLKLFGKREVASYLRAETLSFNQWLTFLKIVWNDEVGRVAYEGLLQCATDAHDALDNTSIGAGVRRDVGELVSLIRTEDFWYHHYG